MAQRARRPGGRGWGLPWSSIGLLALVTLALGVWGFEDLDPGDPLLRHAYRTLQLSVLEASLPGTIPWQLEVARLAAPVLAGYSALRSVLLLSRDRLDLLHARRATGHVVVCGLGDRGALLVDGLRAAGHAVVAVERDRTVAGVDQARRAGAAVVVGDATDEDVLARAGVRRAGHLVSMCDRDAVDAAVALAARRASAGRRDALTCRLEVDDPVLADLLEQLQLGEHYEQGFRLDFLDLWGAAARALVDRFPPEGDGRGRVVVVGLGRFGGSVVAELARRRHAADPGAGPVAVVAVDTRGEAAVAELVGRLPHLREACRIEVCAVDATTPEGDGVLKAVLDGPDPPAAVYVCLAEEAAALAVGLRSRSWLPAGCGVVVVRMRRHGGLAEALEQLVGDQAGIHAFAALDAALAPDLVLGGRVEQIARALHDEYCRSHPDAAAAVPWEELPAALRDSNRDQARHVGVKLRAAGCRLAPLGAWDAAGFAFTDDEVDRLGRMEHDRWVAERRLSGWTPGRRRRGATTTPYLVGWEDLPEDIRQIDRDFVRALPGVLAGAGYEVRRAAPIGAGAPSGR